MAKRIIILLMVVTLVVLPLFSKGTKEVEDPSKPFSGVVINALLEGHPTSEAILLLLPEFEKETGIKVNVEILPFEEMTAKAYLALSQGSDSYDVYMDHWGQGISWAQNGHILPLESFYGKGEYFNKSDFVDPFLKDAVYNDKQFGLPVYGESTFMYYRKDIFDKYGIEVPKTTDELLRAARTIKEKSQGTIIPITLRGMQGVHAVYAWCSFLWGFGGSWLGSDGKFALDSKEAIEATKYYADLLNNYGPPGYANFGWTENRVAFTTGKAAISIDATVNGAYNEDSRESDVAGLVGYAATPVKAGVKQIGGANSLAAHHMYLSNYSKNKDAAWLFMSWATSGSTQLKSQEIEPNSGATSHTAMNGPVYQEKFGAFRDGMLEALDNGNPDYLIAMPGSKEIYDRVGRALSLVLAGRRTAEEAMIEVNKELNELLF